MTPSPLPKKQHYVPQFLLKGFEFGNDQLHAFDKRTDKSFPISVRDAAAARYFYESPAATTGANQAIDALEDGAAPVIQRIRVDESLASLTLDDRRVLAFFVVAQLQRTPAQRALIDQLNADLTKHLTGLVNVPSPDIRRLSKDEVRDVALGALANSPELSGHVLDKSWHLFRTDASEHFYIGDNPVAMQNALHRDGYGTLGLAVPGIEVYLPISHRLTLAFVCKSYETRFRDVIATTDKLAALNPTDPVGRVLMQASLASAERGRALLHAIDTGAPLRSEPENVVNANSLQVRASERFIFSYNGDFELAREMIAAHPELRTGPRLQFG